MKIVISLLATLLADWNLVTMDVIMIQSAQIVALLINGWMKTRFLVKIARKDVRLVVMLLHAAPVMTLDALDVQITTTRVMEVAFQTQCGIE